jgi:hypothetical protein
VTGAAVYVTSTGQLGVLASSERYKTDVASMAASTGKLEQLRPVTFRLKSDPLSAVQYGLIAEEVDKVYPELVIRNDSGKIQSVRYDELAPVLLNEMQKQQRKNTAHADKIDAQAAEIRDLKQHQQTQLAAQSEHTARQDAEIRDLKKLAVEMQAGLLELQARDVLVAQR